MFVGEGRWIEGDREACACGRVCVLVGNEDGSGNGHVECSWGTADEIASGIVSEDFVLNVAEPRVMRGSSLVGTLRAVRDDIATALRAAYERGASEEREACAKVADDVAAKALDAWNRTGDSGAGGEESGADKIAETIRARGIR